MSESAHAPKTRKLLSARRLVLLASGAGSAPPSCSPRPRLRPPASHRLHLSPPRQRRRKHAADRLCRHRREGEARGHLGARQGREPRRRADGQQQRAATPMGPAPGSPMERFFRQFGMPDGQRPAAMPSARPRGRNFITGQGSGFFISADGYAVTNNHVVDKAESGRDHDRRRQDLHRQGDRHRLQDRHRADQGRRPQRLPVREVLRQARRASATGCWRSAIRSASAAP